MTGIFITYSYWPPEYTLKFVSYSYSSQNLICLHSAALAQRKVALLAYRRAALDNRQYVPWI